MSGARKIFVYGCILAALIAILKLIEYNYLLRSFSQEVYIFLIAALFTGVGIWTGLKWVNRKQNRQFAKSSDEICKELGISDREMEVLLAMSEGLSNQQIAERLYLSENTIKTHSSNLFAKLNVKRRTQAVHHARNIGLIRLYP